MRVITEKLLNSFISQLLIFISEHLLFFPKYIMKASSTAPLLERDILAQIHSTSLGAPEQAIFLMPPSSCQEHVFQSSKTVSSKILILEGIINHNR